MEYQSKKKDNPFVKKIKQNSYKWHRTLGIVTILPVLFWTLSGIMHPFMAHYFRPEIAHEKIAPRAIDSVPVQKSVQEVLKANKMEQFKKFRIVTFNNKSYYQVKSVLDQFRYFDVQNAKELANGDDKYAEYLARYFLDDAKSKISKRAIMTDFSSQYKYINRYLPVHQLTFDRPDAMQVYVETSSSKLATYNPRSRQIFIWIFDTFHNWGFMDVIANNELRIIVMILFLSIILFSALSGMVIYGLFWNKFKKAKPTEPEGFLRQNHRKIGLAMSFLTLTFGFSGAYHAVQKWEPNVLPKMIYEPILKVSDLGTPSNNIHLKSGKLINLSVIQFKKKVYYLCESYEPDTQKYQKQFINATNNQTEAIELDYAHFLASKFQKMLQNPSVMNCCEQASCSEKGSPLRLKKTSILTDFDKREYGFVNKRLPVVKLEFLSKDNTTYYIETSTSRLAAIVNDSSRKEGYSFAILHKFLLLEWAGKNTRDLVTVLAALGILVVSILGLILFLKKR